MVKNHYLTPKQLVVQFVLATAAMYLATLAVKSVDVVSIWSIVSAVILIQMVQWIVRPLFDFITRAFGIVGILLLSLFGNAFIVWLTFGLIPGITVQGFWSGFATAWMYAAIITLCNWVLLSRSDDIFLAHIMRGGRKKLATPKKQGFVFIQLDGVSAPVLEWQLKAGNLPNIARLIKKESYVFNSWHTQIPSTTPASQAGILFGNNNGIPAFRWYEKTSGQLVVANQTSGATLIEERCSNGHGLLVDGGVSIGNLFSGDAPTNIMVMSKTGGDRESIKSMREYSSYFYTPYNFMRSFVLSLGEMVKEIYQAKRQEIQNVEPRVKRHGSYVLLRAATNVLLRDLQTTVVIQNMMKGVNSIYVDYLDYDEIAHHAGIARAESLASLSGLDAVVGTIFKANKLLPKPYEIILVSDHGQSQGPTFKQLHNGKTLKDFVAEYTKQFTNIFDSTNPVEDKSAAKSLLLQQSTSKGAFKSSANKAFDKLDTTDTDQLSVDIVVTGSGNLGNIWFSSYKKRLTYDQIQKQYPGFISNLLKTKGIGLVLVMTNRGQPICIGPLGSINLSTSSVNGSSPLALYPSYIVSALNKLCSNENAPDIAVISQYNQDTGEVYAFEELVGNHGGIGGWQTEAILLHPKHLTIPKKYLTNGQLHDATTIHAVMKHWLKSSGHAV